MLPTKFQINWLCGFRGEDYIMVTSFSGGRSWSTRREPPTMGKQLVNFSLADASRVHPF
jgi:hypothetical protein